MGAFAGHWTLKGTDSEPGAAPAALTATWSGAEIRFEALSYSVSGEKATESLSIAFQSPGRMRLKSTTHTAAGDSVLDLTGTRDAAAPK